MDNRTQQSPTGTSWAILGALSLLSRLVLSCLVLAPFACWGEREWWRNNKRISNESVSLNNAGTITSINMNEIIFTNNLNVDNVDKSTCERLGSTRSDPIRASGGSKCVEE